MVKISPKSCPFSAVILVGPYRSPLSRWSLCLGARSVRSLRRFVLFLLFLCHLRCLRPRRNTIEGSWQEAAPSLSEGDISLNRDSY
jgi:hypothetical protein